MGALCIGYNLYTKLVVGQCGAKFAGIDLVWVCWLLVSDSGYNESKFALILKFILTNKL